LKDLWYRYANSQGKNMQCREALLRGGVESLDVLIELLCPPRELSPDGVRMISALVERLGNDEFEVREAASRQLQRMLPAARPLLSSRLDEGDLEIRQRLKLILGDEPLPEREAAQKAALLRPVTSLLERDWPMEELRQVARHNLDRLALVDEVEYQWSARPISPLIASLR
jgi:hypothetical protein